jgi:N-acetylglucosaminyl-diphospho-decaprenol L-rhamnosyltransferase
MTGSPTLTVVVISWKMHDLLRRMLSTLHVNVQGVDFEVVCIDNGSHDGTSEMVSREFPQVRLLVNERNLGVAPARNQGIALARGRYIAILDADLEFVEDALTPLVQVLEADPRVGIAGSRLVFPDGQTQFNAKRFPGVFALLSRRIPLLRRLDGGKSLVQHEMHDWDRKDSREVDYLIGACQVIRREVIETVGPLDEAIFYGPEDIDFCVRTRRAGWTIRWEGNVRIIHHEQRITKRNPFSQISLRHYKGLWYFFRKHGLRYMETTPQAPLSAS